MNESRDDFTRRLLESQRVTPALREKYEMETWKLFEKPVKGLAKCGWIGATVMGVGFLALFGTVAVIAPAEFPLLGRLGFAAGALFGLGWAILGVIILRRGSEDPRTHGKAAAGMGWGVTVIIATMAIVLGPQLPDRVTGVMMIVTVLVFLVPAAMFMTLSRIERAELETREKLLEIEYRLAELAERITKNQER